ncbi:hypothetical protein MTO96_003862 [Rhipicephalus appendiculatus]
MQRRTPDASRPEQSSDEGASDRAASWVGWSVQRAEHGAKVGDVKCDYLHRVRRFSQELNDAEHGHDADRLGGRGVPPSSQQSRRRSRPGPSTQEPPSPLERSPVVQHAEPSAKASVQKKGTLRSFFWGTSSAGKELRSKRKKELLQQLADLQRENARLQSECDHVRLIYSELKQERLIEQEKASRAKALDGRLQSETQLMSSASQTDPCSNLLGEFRAVPRKNYAFIYNVFTVPTPEQLQEVTRKVSEVRFQGRL